MGYDAVIFDLFGTLVDNYAEAEYGQMLSEIARALSVPYDDFAHVWRGTIGERMAGRSPTTEEGIESICADLGVQVCPDALAAAARIRLDFTRDRLIPLPGTLSTLSQLKDLGCKTGLVTDCTTEVPALWGGTPFAPRVDAAVFSCVALCRKPAPEIYHAVCGRLCVDPARCLYVGDGSSHELTGARSIGMHPILITSVHDMPGFDRGDVLDWDGHVISGLTEVVELAI